MMLAGHILCALNQKKQVNTSCPKAAQQNVCDADDDSMVRQCVIQTIYGVLAIGLFFVDCPQRVVLVGGDEKR
jgi:hypothetical protein